VTGAAVGTSLVDEVAGAVTVLVTVGVTVAVAELELTPGVPEEVLPEEEEEEEEEEVPEEGVLPPEAGAVPEPAAVPVVTDGVNVGTVGDVEDPLQAETATGARRVRAPQHRTVSLARRAVPANVVRTFMGPPHAPGR